MTLRRRRKNRSISTVSFFACKSLNEQNLRGNAEQHQWEWEHLIWTRCTVEFELEPTLNSRITLCFRPKPPSSSLHTIAKSVGARKSRYNRFLVMYDLVITDICCVYWDMRPNFSTKFARYIRLLVITGLVLYDFYCSALIKTAAHSDLRTGLLQLNATRSDRQDLMNRWKRVSAKSIVTLTKTVPPPNPAPLHRQWSEWASLLLGIYLSKLNLWNSPLYCYKRASTGGSREVENATFEISCVIENTLHPWTKKFSKPRDSRKILQICTTFLKKN